MARKPQIHFPGALYHVIARGHRRQGIFLDEKDLQRFTTYLSDCKKRFPFRLYAYALLTSFRCLTPISREVCRTMGIEEEMLYTATREREGARGRAVVSYWARRTAGCRVKEIADYFKRSAVTIGEGIMKVEDVVRKDKLFEKALMSMEENVVRGRRKKYRVSVA